MRSTVMALVLGAALCAAGTAAAQAVSPDTGGADSPQVDDPRAGKNVLNAGPEPRVKLPPGSRDHAAIFGSEDEDEQALASQEQALQEQKNQLLLLERLFTQKPAGATPTPPAMMLLNTGSTMRPLAPTPGGSQLDRGKMDEMQRRVDSLRREADTLRQSGK
ncbi:hypothetical protein [Achromobacter kerstersii]|uniref:hypothetical protein n=1 Tax=Achromobacter kerstersii TaxID=1353890 RepID=UPI00320B3E3A